LAAISAAGCAPAQHVLPDPLPEITDQDSLPFEEVGLNASDRKELIETYQDMLIRCAADHGVELTLVKSTPSAMGSDLEIWGGRFGTMTVEHARKWGYRAAPGDPIIERFNVFVAEDESPQVEVLNGVTGSPPPEIVGTVPRRGCRGQAQSLLGGNPEALGPALASDLRSQAFQDPRTEMARAKWSRCMESRGYAFNSVDEPIDAASGPLTSEEKAVAVADVECTASSRWFDTFFVLESEFQQDWLDNNADEARQVESAEQRMLNLARQWSIQRQ
jgi:hypothetical protein